MTISLAGPNLGSRRPLPLDRHRHGFPSRFCFRVQGHLPPLRHRGNISYSIWWCGERPARGNRFRTVAPPPFSGRRQTLRRLSPLVSFQAMGEGDADYYCTPSAQALEHLRKHPSHLPTSFLYLFSASSQSKKRNTSRAANNEQSVPPTPNNRCLRRDDGDGDRADAQEGQRPEAGSSSYH